MLLQLFSLQDVHKIEGKKGKTVDSNVINIAGTHVNGSNEVFQSIFDGVSIKVRFNSEIVWWFKLGAGPNIKNC